MSTQEVVTTGVVLMGQVLSLVALWLQLRFQRRDERERRRYLLTAATVLPTDGRIQEHRGGGTHLALIICATQRNEEQR